MQYGSNDTIDTTNELDNFLKVFTEIYREEFLKPNFHELSHFNDSYKFCGPLGEFSMFHFEDLNGQLKKYFNGTRKPDLQIAHR